MHRVALRDGTPIWLVMPETEIRAGLTDERLSVDKKHTGISYMGLSQGPGRRAAAAARPRTSSGR